MDHLQFMNSKTLFKVKGVTGVADEPCERA